MTATEARHGLILLPVRCKCSCSAHAYNRGSIPSPPPICRGSGLSPFPIGGSVPCPEVRQPAIAIFEQALDCVATGLLGWRADNPSCHSSLSIQSAYVHLHIGCKGPYAALWGPLRQLRVPDMTAFGSTVELRLNASGNFAAKRGPGLFVSERNRGLRASETRLVARTIALNARQCKLTDYRIVQLPELET
jgi:hypothetical protein